MVKFVLLVLEFLFISTSVNSIKAMKIFTNRIGKRVNLDGTLNISNRGHGSVTLVSEFFISTDLSP